MLILDSRGQSWTLPGGHETGISLTFTPFPKTLVIILTENGLWRAGDVILCPRNSVVISTFILAGLGTGTQSLEIAPPSRGCVNRGHRGLVT